MASCKWASSFYYAVVFVWCYAALVESDVDRASEFYKAQSINDPRPFRMNKLNLMWEKAKKILDENQLPNLFAEFVIQDRLEVDWKKRNAEGFDEDGDIEAHVRRKFLDILDRFGLRAIYPDSPKVGGTSVRKDGTEKDTDTVLKEAVKYDPKLAQLWEKAERAGFSGPELEVLRVEFGHLAAKVDEYRQLKQEIDRISGLSQNSIERFKADADEDSMTADKVKQKHSSLKTTFQELKQGYSNLERLTEELLTSSNQKPKEFLDPRVRELWAMAVKANLTEEALASFRTELGHFEKKINKHEFFEKEVQMSKASLNMRGKPDDHLPDSHWKMDQKVKEYALKVKKWYTELKSRLLKASPHGEL